MTIRLDIKGREGTCDQTNQMEPDLIPMYSALEAEGTITRRKGGFAYFVGTFTLKFEDRELFKGTIELLDRVGTHEGEDCNQRSHLEGWLSGKAVGSTKITLRAAMAFKGDSPTLASKSKSLSGTINGALIVCD